MPAAPPLQLSIHAECGRSFVPYLRQQIRAAHRLLKHAPSELSLALVRDATMADLHERFLGVPGPTDVLTFELERRGSRVTAGEVIVCVPQARRQKTRTERHEVLLCALHGLLHLSGFDDKTPRGFAAMHRTEDEILRSVGVGEVFASHSVRPGGLQ